MTMVWQKMIMTLETFAYQILKRELYHLTINSKMILVTLVYLIQVQEIPKTMLMMMMTLGNLVLLIQ